MKCPCCDQEMPSSLTGVDVLRDARVPGKRRKILLALVDAHPRRVLRSHIIDAAWGDDLGGGALTAANTVSVHLHHLNNDIRPYGWQIKRPTCGWGTKHTNMWGLRRIESVETCENS